MGCTPNEAYSANLAQKRTAARELLDVLMLRKIGPVKVGRNGVQYHGLRYGQYALGMLQGVEVYLRVDDTDLTKVSVWDVADRKFLGLAQANRQIPANASRETLREAMAEQRRYRKLLHNAEPARYRIHEDIPETMFRLQQERIGLGA